jgi:hypothetical protein
MPQINTKSIVLKINNDGTELSLSSPIWSEFSLGFLQNRIMFDGNIMTPDSVEITEQENSLFIDNKYENVNVIQEFSTDNQGRILLHNKLINKSNKPIVLNSMKLLGLYRMFTKFGSEQKLARVFQDWGYYASVKPISELEGTISSRGFMLIYNPIDKMAFGAGYTTFERWNGTIDFSIRDDKISSWVAGFDGGDVILDPGEVVLEDMIFMVAPDPWQMLEDYGDVVKERYNINIEGKPPVSWCSWYPERLGVSEERVLANVDVAKERLRSLGLKYMVLDLGWQEGHLSSTFKENDQFPHGLKWLSDKLEDNGFSLGVWTAPHSISEFDPIFKEHPEWMMKDKDGNPQGTGQWFWQPHGDVFCLDLTNPEAQEYQRKWIESLANRGAKYIKPDFAGIITGGNMRGRHNPRIVAGGGLEAARIGAKIIEEGITSVDKSALPMSNGTETAGIGHYKLLYTCNDTGNTGYVGWNHLKETYTTVACHHFKNGRWAFIQPSCLCVGLPGTIDEARLRATATFLCGGQVDIGDELTVLPEDRWKILLATLPTLGKSAKVIDLFEPIIEEKLSYEGMSSGDKTDAISISNKPNASVWHLSLENDWDKWDLVGLFDYNFGDKPEIATFKIPLERLNLDPSRDYWAYEFWSGQFLGKIPSDFEAPHGYKHPGDAQWLISTGERGFLELSYFGPGAKLVALREIKPYPCVVGTEFHQSCGMELEKVVWDETKSELSGLLKRPKGQIGTITINGSGKSVSEAMVDDRKAICINGANGSILLPIITEKDETFWKVRFTNE